MEDKFTERNEMKILVSKDKDQSLKENWRYNKKRAMWH